MANETVAEPKAESFFSLNAEYLIDASSTPGQLLNDVSCLLDSAISVFEEFVEETGGKGWAAMYLMRQAKASHDAAHSLLNKAGVVND